jgi:hypothetical protein
MPMTKELTLCKKSSKLNLNHTPRKNIIESLIGYSKSIQLVSTPIGKFVVVNN